MVICLPKQQSISRDIEEEISLYEAAVLGDFHEHLVLTRCANGRHVIYAKLSDDAGIPDGIGHNLQPPQLTHNAIYSLNANRWRRDDRVEQRR